MSLAAWLGVALGVVTLSTGILWKLWRSAVRQRDEARRAAQAATEVAEAEAQAAKEAREAQETFRVQYKALHDRLTAEIAEHTKHRIAGAPSGADMDELAAKINEALGK